ncbi:lysophospholipid acyltransferase family protein [Xylophilus sp.]|uniref:lysophospholipid acyltransferase family protein n=1 Tax=Xylophilus sp. TaxID=2653893 RepID=UPI0013BE7684|nr:lipid A biosynthesis acyltransferase [Xylophilus sp.]KAF1047676.1 MAG: Lipid A biosynthesis lauroyltransferase [Xylophilus sp.]
MGAYLGILFLRAIAPLPLSWIRALGWVLGHVLAVVAKPRRRVAERNLELCFPQWSAAQRRRVARESIVCFAQAWLDRSWLWQSPCAVLQRRLKLHGALHELEGTTPTIIFCPHFYGLDAGAMAIGMNIQRLFTSIYTPVPDKRVDRWMTAGRIRFGEVRMFNRFDGVKANLAGLRAGGILYLLPDMNFGPQESVFVPFYGVQAATVPSLPRFARLGRAKVVPVIPRMTPWGYDVEVFPAWENYPTDDVVADTALMNRRLQGWIDTMPAQYWWVHRRFKTRPAGEPPVY